MTLGVHHWTFLATSERPSSTPMHINTLLRMLPKYKSSRLPGTLTASLENMAWAR